MSTEWPYSSLTVRKDTAERLRRYRDERDWSTTGAVEKMMAAWEESRE